MSESVVIETPEMRERTRLGMWFFLASEIMFFAGFIGSYVVLRTIHPDLFGMLHRELNKYIAFANTIVLITSSLTMALGVAAAHRGDNKWVANWILATILLGCTFLVVKGFEYSHHLEHVVQQGDNVVHDQIPSASVMYACYFTMTGFHGLHVLVGILVLFVLWIKALMGKFSVNRNVGVEVTGLYWHLVDVIWIFLFPIVYLL